MIRRSPTRPLIRLGLAALTFLVMAAAMILAGGLPTDRASALSGVLPMALGTGLAQWLLQPLFAQRTGWLGAVQDAALFVAVIALGGMLAGTAVLSGPGTILGPIITLTLPLQSPLAALAYLAGGSLVIGVSRRAKASALLQPTD